MKPSVGRIVHVGSANGECLAAIVTAVLAQEDRDPIGAVVFNANGTLAPDTGWRVYRAEPGVAHTWHWPERVDD
jgi:hypothetical protein